MASSYHSTRSMESPLPSKQAILKGIAPDGGLYVSDALLDAHVDLAKVCRQGYKATARDVLSALLDDYTPAEIGSCVDGAYGENFDAAEVTPLVGLGQDWLLELFHGPTSAFKDVALQMLPRLMGTAREEGSDRILVVTATSGDTGKAALEGFADVDGCGCVVFYPEGKVSDIQRLQMVTQRGGNVGVCAVRGNFDDAQTQVKRIFADRDLAERLGTGKVALSSANSINVGRLVPQVAYYFHAYAQLVAAGGVLEGDPVDFCVPTGNFGDVLAGYYAKRMGLPVGKLVVASNANNVLTDFITTGTYDRQRPFVKTISPSMDILVSSNLERLLYYLSGGDCELVASYMRDLAEKGRYTVSPAILERLQQTFACGFADDDATRATIRATWQEEGKLIDTHTAVAKNVLDAFPRQGRARVCLSTASPFKFSADVLDALGHGMPGADGFACMDKLSQLTGIPAPKPLFELRELPERHLDVCDRDQMGAFVESACARVF